MIIMLQVAKRLLPRSRMLNLTTSLRFSSNQLAE